MGEFEYPTQIDIPFADGLYRFGLPMPETNEFERKHGSIMAAEYQLHSAIGFDEKRNMVFVGGSSVNADLCREVIRLALIGGGKAEVDGEVVSVDPQRALELVKLYAYPTRPLEETAAIAWQVLATVVYGREKVQGKARAGD